MSGLGKSECATQDRVIALFVGEPGYRYLGDWSERNGQLLKARDRVWAEVNRPLASNFRSVFPDWRQERHEIDVRWTRKITRKNLADHIFR